MIDRIHKFFWRHYRKKLCMRFVISDISGDKIVGLILLSCEILKGIFFVFKGRCQGMKHQSLPSTYNLRGLDEIG